MLFLATSLFAVRATQQRSPPFFVCAVFCFISGFLLDVCFLFFLSQSSLFTTTIHTSVSVVQVSGFHTVVGTYPYVYIKYMYIPEVAFGTMDAILQDFRNERERKMIFSECLYLLLGWSLLFFIFG